MEQLFTFSEMHFDYSIDATGIGITGECGQAKSGIIIRSQNGAMLVNSGRAKVPTAALVNLLIPDHQMTVPAIRQANRLLQMLPTMGER